MSQTRVQSGFIGDNSVTIEKINFQNALVPVGGIIMWSGTTIPTGWALCNGAAGSGTPDLRNKFIVAADSLTKTGTTSQSGTSPYDPGDVGGDNSVILNTTQIPSHNHTITDPGHAHTYVGALSPDVDGPEQNQSGGPEDRTNFNHSRTTSSKVTGITITNDNGGGLAHENRPPYYALAFIMRIS